MLRRITRLSALAIASVVAVAQDAHNVDPPEFRGSGLGIDCCAIPDVDSDGRPDVAVGAAYIGSAEPGAVYLISSKTFKPLRRIGGRPERRMFGEAIASIELPGMPRVSALVVSSRSVCEEPRTYGIDVVDTASGKLLWDSPLELARKDKAYRGGGDQWMVPLAPAVVSRELRERSVLASTVVVCIRNARGSVELCWVDCAKRERTRSMTCDHIPYRINACPLWRVGDVDADGVEDIALTGEDRVFVYSTMTGARLLEVTVAKQADLSVPRSACKGADYDGDGVPDILIGRLGFDDAKLDWGDVSAYSAKTGKHLKRCLVENRGSGFGASLLALGIGSKQVIVVGEFALLQDGVDIVSASTFERVASIPGVGGDYPEVAARLFDGADFDGDGIVDLLVSRYDCKSPGEDVSGVILYSGKNFSLLGRIELGALRAALK